MEVVHHLHFIKVDYKRRIFFYYFKLDLAYFMLENTSKSGNIADVCSSRICAIWRNPGQAGISTPVMLYDTVVPVVNLAAHSSSRSPGAVDVHSGISPVVLVAW